MLYSLSMYVECIVSVLHGPITVQGRQGMEEVIF